MNPRAARLQSQLECLIAEHSDWLTGSEWSAITQQLGVGLFEDAPELANVGEFCKAVTAALREAPTT